MSPNKRKKIVILGTGGTIAGRAERAEDNIGYKAGDVGVEVLVAAVPGLAELPLVAEQVAQVDSKDMDHALWHLLARRVAHHLSLDDVEAVVITHGTDTIEETAWFLQRLLQPSKPVVLTCAMRPASSTSPDGPQNLLDAVAVAQTPGARGVVVVCAGVIHEAISVQKVHTYRLDAFDSGDAGPLGYVEESAVRMVRSWPDASGHAYDEVMETLGNAVRWPRVEIVMSHAGATGAVVEAMTACGVDGIVVAGTGNGTVHAALEAALLAAARSGVHVRRATRCTRGRVIPGTNDLLQDSAGMSPVKARIDLMLQLMRKPAAS